MRPRVSHASTVIRAARAVAGTQPGAEKTSRRVSHRHSTPSSTPSAARIASRASLVEAVSGQPAEILDRAVASGSSAQATGLWTSPDVGSGTLGPW